MAIKSRTDIKPEFSMSSLTDIIFLLLIFFMLTSSFVSPNGIKLFFPKSSTSAPAKQEKVYVKLTYNSDVYVENRKVDVELLEAELKKYINEEGTVILAADNKANMGMYVKVLNTCNKVTTKVYISKNSKLESL